MRKKLVLIPAAILLLLLTAAVLGACYMVDSTLVNHDRHLASLDTSDSLGLWFDELRKDSVMRDTFMVSRDGFRLHAFYSAKDSACHTAILIHGYKDSSFSMMMLARMYREDLGFNVLIPDLHGHGQSEGDDIRMGWLDRLDIEDWIRLARAKFQTDVVLHGISMGAAAVMMTAGDVSVLPDYVSAAIEDCGYTSVWDEFSGEISNQYGVPAFPFLNIGSAITLLRFGWDFKEASSVAQVSRSIIPMLFIHGDNDSFVPTRMLEVLYKAKRKGYREKYYSKGSAHAASYWDNPQEYLDRVRSFLYGHVFSDK